MRVRIFLRQVLFALPGEAAHVPARTAVLEGTSGDPTTQSVRIFVEAFLDEKGKVLEGAPCELVLPAAKIDHIVVLP